VLVTHNQDEALSLSDRMAIMHRGRIEQLDRPEQFFQSPANAFVARFIGLDNLLVPEALEQRGDQLVAIISGQSVPVRATGCHDVATSRVVIRADRIVPGGETSVSDPHVTLKVVETIFRGLHREVKLAFADGQILVMAVDAEVPILPAGQIMTVGLKPDAAMLTTGGAAT
jgi:spermidine/putrescine transport system ATP-binding protein